MDLIKQLQVSVAPQIFTPRAVYDGRKNLFAMRELPLGSSGSKEVMCLSFVVPKSFLDTFSTVRHQPFGESRRTWQQGPENL
jgi:hypothetical protein